MDIDAALANPSAYFSDPADVLASGLSPNFQLKLLHQWEHDAQLLAQAESEGMTGGEENMLGRVGRALLAFEERETTEQQAAAAAAARSASAMGIGDGVAEIRRAIRARPIAASLLMLSLGFLVGRRDASATTLVR
jgi:hypothetical protein